MIQIESLAQTLQWRSFVVQVIQNHQIEYILLENESDTSSSIYYSLFRNLFRKYNI